MPSWSELPGHELRLDLRGVGTAIGLERDATRSTIAAQAAAVDDEDPIELLRWWHIANLGGYINRPNRADPPGVETV